MNPWMVSNLSREAPESFLFKTSDQIVQNQCRSSVTHSKNQCQQRLLHEIRSAFAISLLERRVVARLAISVERSCGHNPITLAPCASLATFAVVWSFLLVMQFQTVHQRESLLEGRVVAISVEVL